MGNVIQTKTFQLQAPIWSTDTTIAVKNLETIYGDDVVMAGSIQYSTLEPESQSNQEIISFTGITAVSTNVWNLTGVTRWLDAQPTNWVYGSDPSQAKPHASSVDCILSDSPQVWDDKLSKSENETITGLYTFSTSPLVPTPTTASQAATKDYVDGVVASGAADAWTDTKGISRLSYSPTATIGTATMTIASPCVVSFTAHGLTLNDSVQFTTTGALPTGLNVSTNYFVISTGLTADAFQISASLGWAAVNTSGSQSGTHTLYKTTPVAIGNQDPSITGGGTLGTPWSGNKFMTQAGVQSGSETYGADAGGDDTYVVALSPVLTAYTTGQELRFKPTTANTGACTIDFWPGVKNIKTIDGNDPQTGVIRANGVYTVVYDGTSFVLQNEDFATTNNKGIVEMATDAEVATGTDTSRYVTPAQLANRTLNTSWITTRTAGTVGSTQTIAHWLWVTPRKVKINALAWLSLNWIFESQSIGTYIGTSTNSISVNNITGSSTVSTSTTNIIDTTGVAWAVATITTDATNITLVWTGTVAANCTVAVLWEAQT